MDEYEDSGYPGDYINPWFETKAYLMSDSEEVPSSLEPAAPQESPGTSEPSTAEESPSSLEPSAPEPEAPREETGSSAGETTESEAPREETGSGVTGELVQDLITAVGGLNDTITEAAAQDPEDPPAEREGETPAGPLEYEYFAAESTDVDLTPVIQVQERQEEVLLTLHSDLYQLQANVDFVFLAVAALIGVVLGVAVGRLFHDLWRA